MTTRLTHLDYMHLALELAAAGRLTVSPNPMVGCVIVKNDRIVGQGFHQQAGGPHAEIIALSEAGAYAKEATAYITLEPCCHVGKTPPCTLALIKAGIKEVYAACVDPNPLVAGQGIKALQAAGIQVHLGLCETEAEKLNEIFFHYMQHRRPFVIAKWAMSLDGKTITHKLDARDISSPASQAFSHELRQQVDAILIGAHTALSDNPLLTARCHQNEKPPIKQPLRIILSSNAKLPSHLKLFNTETKTLIATTALVDKETLGFWNKKNIEVLVLPHLKKGRINLHALLDALGARKITSLLVEGGMAMHESFIEAHLINQYRIYLAPVIIGTVSKKKRIQHIEVSRLDTDFYFTGTPEGETHV